MIFWEEKRVVPFDDISQPQSPPFLIHPRGYWENADERGHCFDAALSDGLVEFFRAECGVLPSVIDLGCGPGKYTAYLKDRGFDVEGYDGNPHTPLISGGLCHVMDLSSDISVHRAFDWVLSLEVGEHIPAEFEENFIHITHRFNTKGAIVSWAVEGQSGDGHVNCRNNDYVRDQYARLGYTSDLEAERTLRDASTLPWFRNTIMVFRRPMLPALDPPE